MAPKPKPVADRFWPKVDKDGPIVRAELGPCWTWNGARNELGYGYFMFRTARPKRGIVAHRAAWILTHGEVASDICCCHKCDNPSCVNPDHIFLGSHADNVRDCAEKGRAATGERSASRKYPGLRQRGEAHYRAKLTTEDVHAIRASHLSLRKIADQFGVSKTTASEIRRGDSWRHLLEVQ